MREERIADQGSRTRRPVCALHASRLRPGLDMRQNEINRLEGYFKMLNKMEAAPDWDNESFVMRYEGYVNKSEKSLDRIAAADPNYDTGKYKSSLSAFKLKAASRTTRATSTPSGANTARQQSNAQLQQKEAEQARRNAEIEKMRAETEKRLAQQNAEGERSMAERDRADARAKQQNAALAAEKSRTAGSSGYRAQPAGTVKVWLKTTCGAAREYCISDGGSTTCYSIGGNESAVRYAKPGAKVYSAIGGRSTGQVLGTVTKAGQTISVCK